MSLINDVIQHREKQKRKPKGGYQAEYPSASNEWDEESPSRGHEGIAATLSRAKWVILLSLSAFGVLLLTHGVGQTVTQGKRWVSFDPFYRGFDKALHATYALLTPKLHSEDPGHHDIYLADAQSSLAPFSSAANTVPAALKDEFLRASNVPPVPAEFHLPPAQDISAHNDALEAGAASPSVETAQVEAPRPKLASLKALPGSAYEAPKEDMILRPLTYTEPKGVMQLLSKTQALHRIGGSDEAIRLLLSGIQQYPNTRELRAQLASIYLDLGQLDEAERTLQIGMRLDAKHLAYARLLARVYASKQQLPEAITLLIDSAPPMHEEPEHYSLLAALYQQQGRHDLASQLYWELLSLYPDSGRWWTGLGISLEANKAPQMALESYAKALSTTALEPKLRMFVNQRVGELSKRDDVHRDVNLREVPMRKG